MKRISALLLVAWTLPILSGCVESNAAPTQGPLGPEAKESLQPNFRPALPKITVNPPSTGEAKKLEPKKPEAKPEVRDSGKLVAKADESTAKPKDSAADAPKKDRPRSDQPRNNNGSNDERRRGNGRNEQRTDKNNDRSSSDTPKREKPSEPRNDKDASPGSRGEIRGVTPAGGPGGFDGAGFGGAGFGGDFGGVAKSTGPKYKTPTLPSNLPSWFSNDKDGDGQVSMDEWPKDKLSDFATYDRNGDGIITIAEALKFAAPPSNALASSGTSSTTTPGAAGTTPATPAPAGGAPVASAPGGATAPPVVSGGADEDRLRRSVKERMLDLYDKNKDNQLDEREVQETRMLKFNWQQYDTNKDKVLDVTELMAYMKSMGGGGSFVIGGQPGGGGFGGGGFGGGDNRGGGRPGGFGGSPEDRAKDIIKNSDKNADGKLSVDELPFWLSKDRFQEMDANKDGFVETGELMKGFERMGRPGGGRRF